MALTLRPMSGRRARAVNPGCAGSGPPSETEVMEYTRLGNTGLEVWRVALGCMTYGEPDRGSHPWSLGEEASRPFIKEALESGITFFDTANVYSAGSSEEIVGRAL